MTDAPERIYLDGDVEVGDGMFPRCFENAKYASDPPVEYIRSDLASAKLATCEKYRDAYAECDKIATQAVRDLEAKLAKAVEELNFAYDTLGEINVSNYDHDDVCNLNDKSVEVVLSIKATLAELTGGKDD